jgi:putative aldouronate transport system substrate-binding protein
MSITNKCKDPELAIAFYDYLIGFENSLDSYFGPKGIAWTEPDPGSFSFSGSTPLYKALIPYTTAPINTTWDQSAPMIRGAKFRYGEQAIDVPNVKKWIDEGTPSLKESMKTNGAYAELRNYFSASERGKFATPVESMIPIFVMNSADSARAADIDAVLKPAQDQAWVEFITGVRDINNNTVWNAYLAELDRLNSPERVRIIEKYLK